ncbi:uncharacterized protein MKZ38_009205 [Zalerion maritima]|uniref:DUF155 domain-containing protein n=1 Tax=Zalerion maritima TaxID=339359 RepID=A0AAD5WM59_9PEZI|nr:uncharacterized protein MKZ38_009205 [Zalerion maritima]
MCLSPASYNCAVSAARSLHTLRTSPGHHVPHQHLLHGGHGEILRPFSPFRRREFHLTVPRFPRQRTFFTSNLYLQIQQQNKGTPSDVRSSANGLPEASPKESQDGSTSNTAAGAGAASKRKTRASGVKNSLRRVAIIAQQPSRLSPRAQPATDDGVSTIRAVCAAEGYDMDKAMEIMRSHGFSLDPEGAGFEPHEVVHARGAGSGDIFVFPSGTVVTWGLPNDIGESLATTQLLPAAVDPHISRAETEDLEFQPDPSRDTSSIRGDVVLLGTQREVEFGERLDTTLAKIAFSSGLARSTKLAILESSLMDYFESTRRIPLMLSRNEKVPLGKGFILQKTGELLSLRAQLNHYSELTDSLPDIFWDSRQELGLEGYYDDVGRALDVNIRIRTLNQKMDYAQEIASVLREMSSEKHNTRLEVIIIILIAVEVLFELRRVWRERIEELHLDNLEEELEQAMGAEERAGKERSE